MSTISLQRGPTIRSHTAGEILEAWGPSREACLEEAVLALVDSIATVEQVREWWHREVLLAGTNEEVLVGLLEEVIYHLDSDAVPVLVLVHPREDGVLVHLWLTDLHRVMPIGVLPKGVSSSQLGFRQQEAGRWRCTVTIDR